MPNSRARALRAAVPLALAVAAAALAQQAEDPGEPWRLGSLELRSCTIGATSAHGLPSEAAFCTDLEVPEDWDHPLGRRIRLRVAVVRALAAQPDRDVAVFLDGGPGGAATQDYPAVAAALSGVRRQHHLLLVDQRGTGGSNALDCAPAGSAAEDDAADDAPGGAARQARVARCARRLSQRAALQFYATTDAVRDLEAVRLALGAPPLDLVGVSYGTRVAQQYARRYPQAVRRMVLDSSVPNPLVLLSEHARNLEDAVRRRLELCRRDTACFLHYGDSYEALRSVHRHLRGQPQDVEMRDPQSFALVHRRLGAGELAALVRFYAYSAATSTLLPYVIAEAQAGRYAPLLSQAQLVVGDVAEHLNGGMAATVLCTEDADLLREQRQDEDTLLGAAILSEAREACAAWPHGRRPDDFHEPFRGSMPTLVLAGELDPVTPPRYGEQIVAGLPHARLLVAPGQGHAVLGQGCLPRLVGEFLDGLDLERLDGGCLQSLGPLPFFLDVNGPSP
jgi:pimeloyl-ACP methyl ester carboxylesterase